MRGFPLPCRLWIFKKGELLRRLFRSGRAAKLPFRLPVPSELITVHFGEADHFNLRRKRIRIPCF